MEKQEVGVLENKTGHKDAGSKPVSKEGADKIHLELEIEGRDGTEMIQIDGADLAAVLQQVLAFAKLEDAHVFERDSDVPIGREIEGRKGLCLHVHRSKLIVVKVQFEHQTKEHRFAPSVTLFRILQWAVGKKGYNLDDDQRAKANFILPGTDEPLQKDSILGRYVQGKDCELTLVLTLKDFTNG